MMLASIDSSVLFLVMAVIVGAISGFAQKKGAPPKTDSNPAPPVRARQGSESEEERMRRFLEALGIPSDQKPPPPVKRREPPALPTPLPRIEPRGSVVSSPWPVRTKKQRQTDPIHAAPKSPKPAAPFVPPLPHVPPAKTGIPELKTPALPVWDTVSSHVSAIPFEAKHADMRDAYKANELDKSEPIEKLRSLLKSPADARVAILLREIIGPPLGLQTEDRFPNFR